MKDIESKKKIVLRQVQKESSIHDHLSECDNNPSFDGFTILAHRNKKYLLGIKESLLIKCDQPVLNKNISSAMLHLFNTV